MSNYSYYEMMQDTGLWLMFYAFGLVSGAFIMWIERRSA